MFECVSLSVWPNKANYYIFLLGFYFSYQKLKNYCNGSSGQNGVYLYTYSSKSHDLNTVRKPRRSTSLYSTSTKHDSHAPRCYTPPVRNLQILQQFLSPLYIQLLDLPMLATKMITQIARVQASWPAIEHLEYQIWRSCISWDTAV